MYCKTNIYKINCKYYSYSMIDIYSDGACSGNPGPGSWAYVVFENGVQVNQDSGFCAFTTNNKMELQGVIEVLKKYKKCNLYVDSKYVKDGINLWINNWKKNNWKTASKSPVKNQELWMELDELNNGEINWLWIKGHNNSLHDLADILAVETLNKNR